MFTSMCPSGPLPAALRSRNESVASLSSRRRAVTAHPAASSWGQSQQQQHHSRPQLAVAASYNPQNVEQCQVFHGTVGCKGEQLAATGCSFPALCSSDRRSPASADAALARAHSRAGCGHPVDSAAAQRRALGQPRGAGEPSRPSGLMHRVGLSAASVTHAPLGAGPRIVSCPALRSCSCPRHGPCLFDHPCVTFPWPGCVTHGLTNSRAVPACRRHMSGRWMLAAWIPRCILALAKTCIISTISWGEQ